MNITRKDIDGVNAVITLEITQEDYSARVEKSLKDYRQKANMPGFRQGNVPAGLIKKMYGKAILAEEVNKLISEGLHNYITENKLKILAEPISNEDEQSPIDFAIDQTFEFKFDIGLQPEINTDLDDKCEMPYYNIAVTEKMIDENINMHLGRLGSYEKVDVSDDTTLLKGDMTELLDEKIEENSLRVVDALIVSKYMKNEEQKVLFANKKVGDIVVFNPVKAYENEHEISSLLNVAKDKISNYDHDFQYEIKEITKHKPAEINQDSFDKIMGKDVAKNEEDFRQKIKEGIEKSYVADSDYKFALDAKKMLLDRNEKVEFPENFLKRWLKATNSKMDEDTIAKEFDNMLQYLKWDLIKKEIVEANDVKIEEEDVRRMAKEDTVMRFAQYGLNNVQDELIDNYAEEALKQKGAYEEFFQRAAENKVVAIIKDKIKIDNKSVSVEDFNKMFEKK